MEAEASSKSPQTSKLKIAGSWSGVLEAELDVWTLLMLREEVAKRSNCAPDCINLICGGKILKDGDENAKLAQLGLKNNSKILASRVSADQGKALKNELLAEEERSRRLARIKAPADALSKKHADGSLPVEDFNIELEDQSGQKVRLGSENDDQRGVMMGLMFHANAKQLIKKPKDALDVLAMGEHASQEEVKRLEVEKAALARDLSAALLSGKEMQTLLDQAREARAKAEAEAEAAWAASRAAAPSSPSGSEAAREIARLTSENKALKHQLLDMMTERFKESQAHAEQLEKLRQEHMAVLENERARRYRLRDQIREQGVGLSSTWVPARSRQGLEGSSASGAYHPPLDQSEPSQI